MGKARGWEYRFRRIRGDSGRERRIRGAAAVLGIAAFVPVMVQLGTLMIRDYDRYAALALGNQSRTTAVAAGRGDIFDRNGVLLAGSVPVEQVYLDPRELRQTGADIPDLSDKLSEILEIPAEKIEKLAKDQSFRYHLVRGGIDRETADRVRRYINSTGTCGIHLEPGSRRYYPRGSLAGQLVGFSNASGQGSEGIEAGFERFLAGTPGKVITTKGNNEMDMPYSVERFRKGTPGNSVTTTLDVTVQACLENRMRQAIEEYDVRNGAFGLVMNVNTGEILAMATLGSYDPNRYLEIGDPELALELERQRMEAEAFPEDSPQGTDARKSYRENLRAARLRQWRNRCISDGYEPGSTFKTITLASALDCGAVTLSDHFSCHGAEQIPGRSQRLHCWRSKGHGDQDTAQALQNSCNLAFAHIGLKLGGRRFYDYVERFGILEKTGIDLQGESGGVFFKKEQIVDTDKWGTASLTSGSFGQTFKITPLQLVRAIAAVVNGGKLLEPYTVSRIADPHGKILYSREPKVIRQVISPETSRTMCGLIESVVTEGTAKNAAVSGYRVGGKTGTSEKIDVFDQNGQRVQDKIVSFAGIAPMDNPMYIILVALDTPSRETGIYISGGVMAAPTVGKIMGDILPYLEVPRVYAPEDPAQTEVPMPELSGLSREEAENRVLALPLEPVFTGEGDRVIGQLPLSGTMLPGGSQVRIDLGR